MDAVIAGASHGFVFAVRAALLMALMAVSGCATVHLPLCPRISALSYPRGSETQTLNRFVSAALKEQEVNAFVISPFLAQYSGGWNSVKWLEQNYPALLCAFDPLNVIDPKAVHTACVKNAPHWMQIVKENRLDDLFLDETIYKASCYPRIDGG